MKMKNLFVLIMISLISLFSCQKDEITLTPNLQEDEKNVFQNKHDLTDVILTTPLTTAKINPVILVSDHNCKLNLNAAVEPANNLYSYSWKWSLNKSFSDDDPGQELGQGYGGSYVSTEQPIQSPCKTYFIQLTVGLNGVEMVKQVIQKKGDICTDNFQDCDDKNN
jgi:hypothetical protein